MPTKITRENFSKAIHEAVEERGRDYLYPKDEPGFGIDQLDFSGPTCVYVNTETGEPACLIGLALSKIDPEYLALIDHLGNTTSANLLLERLGVEDEALMWAASNAQTNQDCGSTWGESLNSFEATLEADV